MDDAMYDMQTGSQDDGAGHEPVKRKPVRPAELRLDDSKENLGLERVDYGYLSPYLENPGDTRGQGRAPADSHPVDAQPQGQPPMVEPPGRPHRQDQGAEDRRTMGQGTHARRQNGQILRRRVPDP